MTINPYHPPDSTNRVDLPNGHRSFRLTKSNFGSGSLKNAGWYMILVPIAIAYTLFARMISGPGYTTAPNQGAMLVFFLMALAWPLIAIVLLVTIGHRLKIDGAASILVAFFAWALSAMIPFLIGM